MEMETFKLLSLASISTPKDKIYASAAAIGLIDRERGQKLIKEERHKELENLGGVAVLKALAEFGFPEGEPGFTKFMVGQIREHEREVKVCLKKVAIERISKRFLSVKA